MNLQYPEPVNTSYFSIYVVVAITFIVLIVGGIVYYAPDVINLQQDWLSNNVYLPLVDLYEKTVSWVTGKNIVQPNEDVTNYGPATITNNNVLVPEATDKFKQVWCLVGEDMTGRWCIQVPGEGLCEVDRSFPNKNDCERG